MIIAIDPGLKGAIISMNTAHKVGEIHDMPIMAKLTGKGNQVNPNDLAKILSRVISENENDIYVFVEDVHSMPKQGVSSSFQFGHGVGIIHGILAAFEVPMILVTPQKWKKHNGLIGKQKDASRSLAITRHPEVAEMLKLKKHTDRADAICIGDYAVSTLIRR